MSTHPYDHATSRRRRRRAPTIALRVAVATGLLTGLLLVPAIALGHAELATVTPADTSTVQGPPTEIVMTFTEPVDPAKSSIKLIDAAGKVIAEGSTVDAADAKTMRLALTTLDSATYTARWTTASALDGDLDHGTTTFSVATAASGAPTTSPSQAGASPSAAAASPVATSVVPSPSASAPPTTPAVSSSDAVIPVIVALIVAAGLGLWLMRGRSRAGR